MTSAEPFPAGSQPVLPAYGGGCVSDIVPAILEAAPSDTADGSGGGLLPPEVSDARAVVMLVLDGLGAEQLAVRRHVAPTLHELQVATVTSVAPSTTASALTSIATGVGVGEHGIVGYRIRTADGNLNILQWRTPHGSSLERHPPERFQPVSAFGGQCPPALQNSAYGKSGFSRAYLRDARRTGYKLLSSLVVEVRRLLTQGESFVYAYYEGPDVAAHDHGFGEHYDAELRACDQLMADLLTAVPRGTAVVATADHGLVDCTGGLAPIDRSVLDCADGESGEARFRWLHARRGRLNDLRQAALDAHGDMAWVRTADEIIDDGWLGPVVTDAARARLGDVALVARDSWAFEHPQDNKSKLVGRHGSLTPAEMLVPLLVHAP
ncbi:MAG: alkaline phosphatase family protein [Acidimicrobiaceae bacterium]|nr:alkaline phosphatase family protein [Acidimicrobiaceae bacterium]